MKKLVALFILIMFTPNLAGSVLAFSDNNDVIVKSNAAKKFAVLPKGIGFPEGIAVNPNNGDIIVGTFDFPGEAAPNYLLRFNKSGKIVAKLFVGDAPLLGLAYNPDGDMIYFASVGDFTKTDLNDDRSNIMRIEADFTEGSRAEEVAEIPRLVPQLVRIVGNPDGSLDEITFGQGASVPNGLVFTESGDLYISDSFQGAIFRILNPAYDCPGDKCAAKKVIHDSLLATAGFPPFGANGLALNKDETELFIANTGDDRVLKLDLYSKEISVFAESINGADGLAMDRNGILWVAANQADNVVALNKAGRVVARLGAFLGIRRDGSARGLIFPASLVIVRDKMFVTNLAVPLRDPEFAEAEPEADTMKYTISRINIPRLRH